MTFTELETYHLSQSIRKNNLGCSAKCCMSFANAFFVSTLGVTSLWPRPSECQWVVPLQGRRVLERQRQLR